jgi:hypothetical protein
MDIYLENLNLGHMYIEVSKCACNVINTSQNRWPFVKFKLTVKLKCIVMFCEIVFTFSLVYVVQDVLKSSSAMSCIQAGLKTNVCRSSVSSS